MNFIIYLSLSIISKILASGREFGIGYFWGAGSIVDGFIIAMMLPMFFVDIANVLFNSTYISIYVKNDSSGRKQFFIDANLILFIFLVITSLIIYVFLKYYSNFASLPAETSAVIKNIQIYVVVYYIIMVICEFFKAHLMACERQKIMPLPMIFSNLIFILCMYYFSGQSGNLALILCFVFSAVIQLLIYLLITFNKTNENLANGISLKRNENNRAYLKNIPPVIFNAAVNQSSKVTDKLIASSLIIGSLSTLYFAQQMYALYVNVIIVSILTFAYPKMCRETVSRINFSRYVMDVIILLLVIISFPLVLGWAISDLIFTTILSKTSPENAKLASSMFIILSFSLIFESISSTIKRAYWAIGKMKVTVCVSAITVILNIIFSISFSYMIGVTGLVYSYCISSFLSSLLLLILFYKEYPLILDKSNMKVLMKSVSLATVTFGVLCTIDINIAYYRSLIITAIIIIISSIMFALCIYKGKILKVLN